MQSTRVLVRSVVTLALSLALLVPGLLSLAACPPPGGGVPGPRAGVFPYEAAHTISFPHGVTVNAVGGNLQIARTDMSIQTRIGTWTIDRVYNSTTGKWLFNFDMTHDGTNFKDATGAVHNLSAIAHQEQLQGTIWVKNGSSQVKTLGGLKFAFSNGVLEASYWVGALYPRLKYIHSTIAGNPHVTRIDHCKTSNDCQVIFTIDRDGSTGRVDAVTDWGGRRAEYVYNANGDLLTARDALAVQKAMPGDRYTYLSGKIRTVTNSENESMNVTFTGQKTKTIKLNGEQNPITVFDYPNWKTNVTNALGGVTSFHYDSSRRTTRTVSPEGDTVLTTWANGIDRFRPARVTDPAGVATSWTYPDVNTVRTTLPSSNVVETRFKSFNSVASNRRNATIRPVASVHDSLGALTDVAYGTDGRVSTVTNAEGEQTVFTYSAGLLWTTTDAAGVRMTYSNPTTAGLLTRVTVGPYVETRTFDNMGNETVSLNGDNPMSAGRPGVSSRAFDHNRNLSSMAVGAFDGTSAITGTFTITRRNDGRMTRVTRPYGGDHKFSYDALGRVEKREEYVSGAWQETIWEHDALGRTTAEELPNGMRREMDYDLAGRLTARRLIRVSGSSSVTEQSVSYTYVDGRLDRKVDSMHGGSPETILYDFAGRPQLVTFPQGETMLQLYDVRSRPTTVEYRNASGQVIHVLRYRYDLADRRIEVLAGPTYATASTVVDSNIVDGRVSSETFGSGLVRTYSYDLQTGEVVGATSRMSGANREVMTTNPGFRYGPVSTKSTTTQTWAPTSRTTHEEHTVIEAGFGKMMLNEGALGLGSPYYHFDLLTNVTGGVGNTMENASYNGQHNRIIGGAGRWYTHDDAGFVTQRGNTSFAYNVDGRVTQIGNRSFAWDTEGRPLGRILGGVATGFSHGGAIETNFGVPAAIDLGFAHIDLQTGARKYRHRDHRGNVKLVTDDTGDVVVHNEYDAWRRIQKYGSGNDDKTFAGGRELGEGLVMLGLRVYDSDANRFLSPDPVFQIRNQYQYSEGNPIQYWDPNGRQTAGITAEVAITAGEAVLVTAGTVAAIVAAPTVAAAAIAWGLGVGALAVLAARSDPAGVQVLLDKAAGADTGTDTGASAKAGAGAGASDGGKGSSAPAFSPAGSPGGRAAAVWLRWRGGPKGGGKGDESGGGNEVASLGDLNFQIAIAFGGFGNFI